MTLSNFIEIFIFLGGIVGVWISNQTKLKELEIRMLALEKNIRDVEKQDNKIMDKLETISDKINELKIELTNKVDRP